MDLAELMNSICVEDDNNYNCSEGENDEFSPSDPDWPFNQLSSDYKLLGCSQIDEIDAKDITPFFFYKHYVSKGRPVVINNALSHWPAMNNRRWTDEYLLQTIGDTSVTIDFTPDGRADAACLNSNYPQVVESDQFTGYTPSTAGVPPGYYSDLFVTAQSTQMRFADFASILSPTDEHVVNHRHESLVEQYQQHLESPSDTYPGIPYCQRQNGSFTDEFGSLHQDVDVKGLQWANATFECAPEAVNFWMGSSFSHTSMHQDWFENIYAVVRGEKIFTLVPPCDAYWLPKDPMPTVTWRRISTRTIPLPQDTQHGIQPSDLPRHTETDEEIVLVADPRFNNTTYLFNYYDKIYRVVDRSAGDNCEYVETPDQLNAELFFREPQFSPANPSAPEAASHTNHTNGDVDQGTDALLEAQELVRVPGMDSHSDLTFSSCQYLLSGNPVVRPAPDGPHNTTQTELQLPIEPLIMVKKGNYVTIPYPYQLPPTPTDGDAEDDTAMLPPSATTNWITVDVDTNPTLYTPGTQRAKHMRALNHASVFQVSVKAGQVIYLPTRWFHAVRQRGVTISVNYWYDMEYDHHFVYQEFAHRIAESKNASE